MKTLHNLFNRTYFFKLRPHRKGNCKNVTMGMQCEVGLRRKTYNVLAGSVLSVWTQVEQVLTYDGNRRGANSRMQVRGPSLSL